MHSEASSNQAIICVFHEYDPAARTVSFLDNPVCVAVVSFLRR